MDSEDNYLLESNDDFAVFRRFLIFLSLKSEQTTKTNAKNVGEEYRRELFMINYMYI